jgi:hypothetical protein
VEQLEPAVVLAERLALEPLEQRRPALLLAPEVQRASEEQPVRAEQQAVFCQE